MDSSNKAGREEMSHPPHVNPNNTINPSAELRHTEDEWKKTPGKPAMDDDTKHGREQMAHPPHVDPKDTFRDSSSRGEGDSNGDRQDSHGKRLRSNL